MSAKSRSFSGWSLFFTIIVFSIIAVFVATIDGHLERARGELQKRGYTDITVENGYAWCWKDEWNTYFTAVYQGKEVKGRVCENLFSYRVSEE